MTSRLPLPKRSSIFRGDEPVVQSHPLLPGARPPVFSERECWDLNGVLRKPVNQHPSHMRVPFPGLTPAMNLLARELAMIWFNPRHPALLTRGIHLPDDPRVANTVRARTTCLRELAAFGADQHLPELVSRWAAEDFHRFLAHHSNPDPEPRLVDHIVVIKALHRFGRALADGGLKEDPWPGMSAVAALRLPVNGPLKTPVVKPETWFPLVRAAWTYITVFAPDILRALDRWQAIEARTEDIKLPEADRRLTAWLADPASRVPARPPSAQTGREGPVHWDLLARMVGLDADLRNLFSATSSTGRARRAAVERLVAAGRVQYGLLPDLLEVDRPDGSRGPWHDALLPRQLGREATALRNACYIFVAALSMMRDSEIREITKGSVVEYFSTPAVKSTKVKLDADLPVKHWWITEPVAQAIELAERLSQHPELAFASVPGRDPETLFTSQDVIEDFVDHANRGRHITGLDEIPPQHITPHMFRRTMAMLTRDFPGSEIAVGMQLKHAATRALANRTTGGYMEPASSWARHLDNAIAERKFQRVKELFAADSRGETIGFGPGADRMREAFAAVREKAAELRATGKAQRGDLRVEHDLLQRTRFSIRFGKLNHCTMNDDDPIGAKCLEEAVVPEGHRGPLLDRCQPSRCTNSILGPEHLPIWTAEQGSLNRLRADPKLPANRRALLDAQLNEVALMLKKAGQ
ncbi:hypothetical protein [Streptomyces sp. CB02959]|uniref:hypothetical protein n=1 Tax=Streptomyces sp. CB02959 TaxID=2020330 RepID=UPI002152E218|nr:hypothetical protein [Streptomyces sp. CB02959]